MKQGDTVKRFVWMTAFKTLVMVMASMYSTTTAFWLINKPDTLLFLAGVMLLLATVAGWVWFLTRQGTRIRDIAEGAGVVVLAVLLVGCSKTVPPGYTGIEVDYYGGNRGVQQIPIVTGRVWYNPFTTSILEYPTFMQSTVWTRNVAEGHPVNEEISFTNKDQMLITADISLSYQLGDACVPAFYVKFRSDDLDKFTHGYMRNVARDTFDSVAGRYAMDQIMGDNNGFLKEVRGRLQEEVKPLCVTISQFGFIGAPRPPAAVVEAINGKAKATQDAIRVENELRATTAEAQKSVARAEGDARARIAAADGEAKANQMLASSLTPTVIEWQRLQLQQHQISKWNGVLPTVSTGSTPFLLQPVPQR